ncbi:MAG: AIR synthase, partial [Candidatus Omnitrophica bacterium]|nr:AIR synthase [Candidatus Omnitrophota bacterium]
EMATHSRIGLHIYLDQMILQEEVKKTCECFAIDPFRSISEGTLLASVNKKNAKKVVRALEDEGISASICGEAAAAKEGLWVHHGTSCFPLAHPKVDPFWTRFEEYLKK